MVKLRNVFTQFEIFSLKTRYKLFQALTTQLEWARTIIRWPAFQGSLLMAGNRFKNLDHETV